MNVLVSAIALATAVSFAVPTVGQAAAAPNTNSATISKHVAAKSKTKKKAGTTKKQQSMQVQPGARPVS